MKKCWGVFSGRIWIDMFYCDNEIEAIEQAKKIWGDPRNYTDTSNGAYWARVM